MTNDQMTKYTRPAWIEVDLDAIRSNFRAMKSKVSPETKIMAVVKANAYGHGAVEVARVLKSEGAGKLAVALPEEGLELRRAGIEGPLHLLAEPSEAAVPLLLEHNIVPAVSSLKFAGALSFAAQSSGRKIAVHLKIDTGMSRMGAPWEEAVETASRIINLPGLTLEGAMTHLACADQKNSKETAIQIQRFNEVLSELENRDIRIKDIHMANSAATLLYPETHHSLVRWGITLYGLYPGAAARAHVSLRPALSLKARASRLFWLEAGEAVSYGATYRAETRQMIATLPLGYADGYSRRLSNRAQVLVGAAKSPVLGTVTMDQIMIEIPESLGKAMDNEEVVLLGRKGDQEITADDWAAWLDTINYEIVCGFSARLPRLYLNP